MRDCLFGLFFLVGLCFGCSSIEKSVLLGVGTGLVLGSANGAVMQSENRGHIIAQGALIGGVVGGIVSYFTHNALEQRDEKVRRETLFNLEKFNVLTPAKEINHK